MSRRSQLVLAFGLGAVTLQAVVIALDLWVRHRPIVPTD